MMTMHREAMMDVVTVSSRSQIMIPPRVCDAMGLRPGQKVQVLLHDRRIELIPVRPIQEMRGFVRGIDTDVDREANDMKR